MQDRFDASGNSQNALKINFGTPKETPKSSFLVSKVVPKLIQDCSNASESFPQPSLSWRTIENFDTTPDFQILPSMAGHKSTEIISHWKTHPMASLGIPTKAKI